MKNTFTYIWVEWSRALQWKILIFSLFLSFVLTFSFPIQTLLSLIQKYRLLCEMKGLNHYWMGMKTLKVKLRLEWLSHEVEKLSHKDINIVRSWCFPVWFSTFNFLILFKNGSATSYLYFCFYEKNKKQTDLEIFIY